MTDTPEANDSKERINKFIDAYGALVKEHKVDFASIPQLVPDEKDPGSFKMKVQTFPIDVAGQPTKSPFIE